MGWLSARQADRAGPAQTVDRAVRFVGSRLGAPGNRSLRPFWMRRRSKTLIECAQSFDVEREIERIERLGIEIVTLAIRHIPDCFAKFPIPPAVLYVKGTLLDDDIKAVGIVGTRRCTRLRPADRVNDGGGTGAGRGDSRLRSRAGYRRAGASGSARRRGRTIAVLGSGVDHHLPVQPRDLAERISKNGAVISDYPPGTKPDARNFPPRNRIIAGMSKGWSWSKRRSGVAR